ncbi:hypothetical protein ABT095_00450 [Kitasatospora sp. NPDC002227]|uniref:hypothetical protein n=1 Tax=Kitasatospora sp. NPDC002227 TaxID=3154773 RepID=UPI00333267C2
MNADGRFDRYEGEVAVFRGVRFAARSAASRWPCVELLPEPGSSAPEGVAPRYAADGSVAGYPLAPDRLDAWYAVHRTFRWRGELFECTGATDATIAGHYLGDDQGFADEHLKRRVIGYRGEFPRGEVTDPTERREDLLGPRAELLRRLAEANDFRPEACAVHRGGTYPADARADASGRIALTGAGLASSGLPADPRAPDGNRYLATPEQLEAWYRTHWTFRWEGGPFEAVGTVEGRIKGVYTGADWGFVDSLQLTRETAPHGTPSRYTVEVDLDTVTDLERHRTDLLTTRQ